ncbi:hypothetical protein IWW48_003470 [Coemansia sp. RSA 1200]|nr:hypothetical protein IWW48_003470 [Coemansia sp. RSA 1200]
MIASAQDEAAAVVSSVKMDGVVYAWETNDRYASESPYADEYGLVTMAGNAAPEDDNTGDTNNTNTNVLNIANASAGDETSRVLLLLSWLLDKLGIAGSSDSNGSNGRDRPPHKWHGAENTVTVTVTDDNAGDYAITKADPEVSIVVVTPTVAVTQAVQSVAPSYGFNMVVVGNAGAAAAPVAAEGEVSYVPVTVSEIATVTETNYVTVEDQPMAPAVYQNVQQIVQTMESVFVSQVPVVQTRLTASAEIVRVVGPTYTSTINQQIQFYNAQQQQQQQPQLQQQQQQQPQLQQQQPPQQPLPSVYTL